MRAITAATANHGMSGWRNSSGAPRNWEIIQVEGKKVSGSSGGDQSGEREAHIIDALPVANDAGDGEDGVLVAQDSLEDSGNRQSDGPVGGSLGSDDLRGGVADVAENGFALVICKRGNPAMGERGERNVADMGAGPDGYLAVAVLADDIGVDVGGGDLKPL